MDRASELKTLLPYRREIDGLRALAVLAVLIFHGSFTWGDLPILSGGYLGVDVFFVVSGYLISRIILQSFQENSFSLWSFYERRARRILPALYFLLLLCLPLSWYFFNSDLFVAFLESVFSTVAFVANFHFWIHSGYFDQVDVFKPLLHAWSLSVEEQFYLIFPAFLLLLRKRGRSFDSALLYGTLSSFLLACVLSYFYPKASFFLLPTRSWELMVGAWIAQREMKGVALIRQKGWDLLGLMAMVLSFVIADQHSLHPGPITLLPVMGAALILASEKRSFALSKFLESRVMVGIGLVSYSLYLWHPVVLAFAQSTQLSILSEKMRLALLIACVPLAALSWRFVEQPFRSSHRISPPMVFRLALYSGLFLMGASLVAVQIPSRRDSFPLVQKLKGLGLQEAKKIAQDGRSCHGRELHDPCVWNASKPGEREPDRRIIVIGDSHAATLVPELLKVIGPHDRLEVQVGCFPAVGITYKKVRSQCLSRSKELIDRLAHTPPSTLLMAGRLPLYIEGGSFDNGKGGFEQSVSSPMYPYGAEDLSEIERKESVSRSLQSVLKQLLSFGHKLVLVYPVPEAGWNIPQAIFNLHLQPTPQLQRSLASGELALPYEVFKARSASSYKVFDSVGAAAVARVYPERVLCNTQFKGQCLTHSDDEIYYSDDDHLSAAGVRLLIPEILKALN